MRTKVDFIKLPKEVACNGVGISNMTATLVERTDKKAIYLRWDGVYEVFRIAMQEATEIFGNHVPKKEAYPGNEKFGTIAWSFRDKDSAMAMYRRIPDHLPDIVYKGSLNSSQVDSSATLDDLGDTEAI
jgi:hypothetical protein